MTATHSPSDPAAPSSLVACPSPSSLAACGAGAGSAGPPSGTVGLRAPPVRPPSTSTTLVADPPSTVRPVRVNGHFLADRRHGRAVPIVMESVSAAVRRRHRPPRRRGPGGRRLPQLDSTRRAGPRPGDLGLRRGDRHVSGERRRRPADHRPRGRSRSAVDPEPSGSAAAAAGHDVQPHVVDERLADARPRPRDERVVLVGRQALEVGAEHDRPQVGLERLAAARSASARRSASTRCRRSRPRRAGASSPAASRSGPARASRRRSWRARAGSCAMLPTPPHWATSRPPGRRTAARLANSASWSGTQWNVAVERIGVDRLVDRAAARRGRRRRTRPGRRSGRAARARPRPSTASRRARRRARPAGARAALGHAAAAAARVEDALVAGAAAAGRGRRVPQRVIGSATRS